jgi:polysaccharide export outer membrane protein
MNPLTDKTVVLFGALAVALLMATSLRAQPPATGNASAASPESSYRIRSGDKLNIKFVYQPELNEPSAIVRPDGFITLSMIDEVRAKGLTVAELKSRVEDAYKEILLNPVVSINLTDLVAPCVYVGGQVNRAGSYELRAGQTVVQAVILAGGFTREAHRKMVLHARPDGKGNLKVTQIDVTDLFSRSGNAQELLLRDGDYVYVPDSKLSRFSRVVEAFRFAVPGFGGSY